MARIATFFCLFGTNGTGKSTFIQQKCLKLNRRNLVIPANTIDKAWKKYPRIKPKRSIIIDPNDPNQKRKKFVWTIPELNTFTGTKVLDVSMVNNDKERLELFEAICRTPGGIRGAGLVIDDYKNWLKTKGTLPYHVRQLLGDRRHRELDLFLATHGFQEFNSDFIQFAPNIVMFNVTLPPNETVEKKIGAKRWEAFMKIYNRVKEKSKTNQYYYEGFKLD